MYLFLAIVLLSCAQFGSQIFMPALPAIAEHFNLDTSTAQLVVMIYFIGFGLSQLIYGPWSDIVGRRKVFLIGQQIYILGSVICVLAASEWLLAGGRLVQGVGAGAALIVSRTILSDHLTGNYRKSAMATLAIAASFISVVAPFLGGFLTTQLGWMGLFVSLMVYLVITGFLGFVYLPKSGSVRRNEINNTVFRQYAMFLTDGRFILPAVFKWLPTTLYLTSATFLPFIIQRQLELTPQQYGIAMTLPALGLIVGTSLAKALHAHIGYPAQILIFMPLLFLAGLGFYFMPFSLVNVLISYCLFMICAGAFYTHSLHLLIEPYSGQTGSVNALCGAIDMLLFSSLVILINKFWVDDMASLGQFYLVMSSILLVTGLLIFQRAKKQTLVEPQTA